MIVSFDFDSTLSRKDVQIFADSLIKQGIEVWIVTSRFDDVHLLPHSHKNDDLWLIAKALNIPERRVRFTLMEPKANFLFNSKIDFHIDDDEIELEDMSSLRCKTIGLDVNKDNWKKMIENRIKSFVTLL